MKYIKKPLVVDAFQYGESVDYPDWFYELSTTPNITINADNTVNVMTAMGIKVANKGDYIVKYENGDLYVYSSDFFNQMFEVLITPDMLGDH